MKNTHLESEEFTGHIGINLHRLIYIFVFERLIDLELLIYQILLFYWYGNVSIFKHAADVSGTIYHQSKINVLLQSEASSHIKSLKMNQVMEANKEN